MLTFTMPGDCSFNAQGLGDAWAMFGRFLQRARRAGLRFQYVAVPEKQKRGAWHFHVAVDVFLPIGNVQAEWFSVGGGNVDVKFFEDRHGSEAAEGCAVYLGKYIGKELESSEFGRQRYRTSQGIKLDVERLDVHPAMTAGTRAVRTTFQAMTGLQAGKLKKFPYVVTVASWGDGDDDYCLNVEVSDDANCDTS
jgi:hypothetical protein